MSAYPDDVLAALSEASEFYEYSRNPRDFAMAALVGSALAMAESGHETTSQRAHIKQALMMTRSDLADRMDVVDGPDGPEPDAAMTLHGVVDEALLGFEVAA